MQNVLIVGSGRSGTSMAASLFADAGYFMGTSLLEPGPGNVLGFFESAEVNAINEGLLDQVIPARPSDPVRRQILRSRPRRFQRWAAGPSAAYDALEVSESIRTRIRAQLRTPFCLKDPRFCFTLPAWLAETGPAVLVCVFRHPGLTVASTLKQGRNDPGMRDFRMKASELFRVWGLQHSNILRWANESTRPWVFLEYEDLLATPSLTDQLAAACDTELRPSVIDTGLRTVDQPIIDVPPNCIAILGTLREKALRA